jgi:hypothetical protein
MEKRGGARWKWAEINVLAPFISPQEFDAANGTHLWDAIKKTASAE